MVNIIKLSDYQEGGSSAPIIGGIDNTSENVTDIIRQKAYDILEYLGLAQHFGEVRDVPSIKENTSPDELPKNVTRLDMTQKFCSVVRSFFSEDIGPAQSLDTFLNYLLDDNHHIIECSIVPGELKTLILGSISRNIILLNSEEAKSLSISMLNMINQYKGYGNPWVFIYTRESLQNHLKTIENTSIPEPRKDGLVVNLQTRNTPDFSSLSKAFYRPYTEKPRHIANQDS